MKPIYLNTSYRPNLRLDPHEQALREVPEQESYFESYRWVLIGGVLWAVAYVGYWTILS